jgi:hypothetical protein
MGMACRCLLMQDEASYCLRHRPAGCCGLPYGLLQVSLFKALSVCPLRAGWQVTPVGPAISPHLPLLACVRSGGNCLK